METTNSTPKRRRREPRAWLCIDGKKMPLVVEKPTKLSAYGIWCRENPVSIGLTKAEIRALLK